MIPIPEVDFGGILPALVLCVGGLIVMVAGLFIPKRAVVFSAIVSLAAVLVAFALNSPLRMMTGRPLADW